MKTVNQLFIMLFVISFFLLACNKDKKPPVSQQEMWDCHNEMNWDSVKTKNSLLGEWEWEYIYCYWYPEEANYDEYKGLVIEFKPDNTLHVKENGQITQTSKWKVVKSGSLFNIDVEPRVSHLYGMILFCDDRVEFNNSYIDGCDNYFKRKE